MTELWKDMAGYEGYYKVSNHGAVMSMRRTSIDCNDVVRTVGGKTLSNHPNNRGVLCISTTCEGTSVNWQVAKLVWTHFSNIPRINPRYQYITHRDGNKLNCHLDNLELRYSRDVIVEAKRRHGMIRPYIGAEPATKVDGRISWHSTIKDGQVSHYLGHFNTPQEASRAYNNRARQLRAEKLEGVVL